ncbi:MAG: excinuclease ABC subunit UvrC [Candidatus Hydrogenedentes bacterium]|nr:excinuclease ABC subunit UvrC [Candidatus Hydrogenedentota bacterium]
MEIAQEVQHERINLSSDPTARASAVRFLETFDISRVPTAPGCYLMSDARHKLIYVGKAKNLRARLRNYINESDARYSVKFIMSRVAQIDFLVTANEKEALLLENSLIKKHHPRYNVRLKDDKTYLSVRIDPREEFPRITVVRRHGKDGAKYFGPYHSAGAVRQTLRQMQRLFPLRTCSDHVLHNRTRPCLYYQMKQCVAPCVGHVDAPAYHELAEQVVLALEGRNAKLEKLLIAKIKVAADKMAYEQAATLRDRLYDLRRTLERQRIVDVPGAEDRDVFGYYAKGSYTEIQVLFYRAGKMLGGKVFSFERREMPVDELLSSLLLQYYSETAGVPAEVLVPVGLEEAETLGEILSEQRGTRVTVHHPVRGEKRALVDLAMRNAERSFEEKQLGEKANQDLLRQVQESFHLPKLPVRIECFDISTIQGNRTVGSMVTFENALPNKDRYRRFSIKTVEGQDDFASMREMLMRRYTKAIAEDDLPDLVLIDGGKGQLNVATAVFQDLGIEDLPHLSIAKARVQEAGGHSPERFFMPGRMNAILLPQSGPLVQLFARIRDEAHRFAITYHRKQRGKATLRTSLTAIPGVGPARARTLLNTLGSVARIREASVEEIAALPGFNQKLAEAVRAGLHDASG